MGHFIYSCQISYLFLESICPGGCLHSYHDKRNALYPYHTQHCAHISLCHRDHWDTAVGDCDHKPEPLRHHQQTASQMSTGQGTLYHDFRAGPHLHQEFDPQPSKTIGLKSKGKNLHSDAATLVFLQLELPQLYYKFQGSSAAS